MAKQLTNVALLFDPKLAPLLRDGSHGFSPNLVQDAYRQALPKVTTHGIGKVIVNVSDGGAQLGQIGDLDDVLEIGGQLDPARYAAADGPTQRRMLLDILHAGVTAVASAKGWELGPFEQAYQQVLANEISLQGTIGRKQLSADKRLRAQLEYVYRQRIEVTLLIEGPEGVKHIPLASLPAVIELASDTFGALRWISDNQLEILHKNKKDRWQVTLSDPPVVELETERAARGDGHGLYDLGLLYAKGELVPKDLERARALLERAVSAGYARAQSALRQLEQES